METVLQRKIKYESIERMHLCTIIFNYPTGWGAVQNFTRPSGNRYTCKTGKYVA